MLSHPARAPRIPQLRDVDHLGLTVSDLEPAIGFFTRVLGCELLYRAGPFSDADGEWMTTHLGAPPRAVLCVAMLRCGPTTNVELCEYQLPDGAAAARPSEAGAGHLALCVDDLDAALAALAAEPDVTVLGAPTVVTGQPSEGVRFVFCRTTWGLTMELCERPAHLPYELTTTARMHGPAASWTTRPVAPDGDQRRNGGGDAAALAPGNDRARSD